jgi:L-ascorbate metabolism protein UlaG (beta-lactamase superfamily)
MNELKLTHIGGPTVLIETGGWRILTDPTFDPAGGHYKFGLGTSSDKTADPAIAADEIGPLDAVLLSHDQHGDNLDTAGRKLLETVPKVITTVSGAKRLGARAEGLAPWATTKLEAPGKESIAVQATPCRHGPPLSRALVGDVIGFSLTGAADGAGGSDADGDGAFWISGDTVLYPGVREVADRIKVSVAMIHLGGVRFPISGPCRYTMTAKDAAELCGQIRPRVLVPIHYEGWSHFKEGRAEAAAALGKTPVQWLEPGVPTTLAV